MSAGVIQLHPSMTLEQAAAWCARHRKIIQVSHEARDHRVVPVLVAIDDTPDLTIPAFLRRQAD